MNKPEQRIVCAACRNKDNHVIIGIRHFDTIMHTTIDDRLNFYPNEHWANCEQGFLDQYGEFFDRKTSWLIACSANQIIRLVGNQTKEDLNKSGVELYSENLY